MNSNMKGNKVIRKQRKGKHCLKQSKIVSHIHVGNAGKEDLEKYLRGEQSVDLQVFSEENLPDLSMGEIINGLDHVGTSGDYCDDSHRCSSACPVGCQGHLRPNEVFIYESEEMGGVLIRRKKYRARFIIREHTSSKQGLKSTKMEFLESREIGECIPEKYQAIINGPTPEQRVVFEHGWNPRDRSGNLTMKSTDHMIVRRQPVTQSTDGVRGKKGFSRGVHIYEIGWPARLRGTHAAVGIATLDAPLHSWGYRALIGSNEFSWGWDIGRKECLHDGEVLKYPTPVRNHYQWAVPEFFYLIVDMDEGTVSFAAKDKWLGVAFTNLQTNTVYPAISTVWGHAEISIRFIGSNRPASGVASSLS